jgi:hypothetical protein
MFGSCAQCCGNRGTLNHEMKVICPTPWLGFPHGYLTDWVTQRWVQLTGQYIDLGQNEWLEGPIGKPEGIGKDYFDEFANDTGLSIRKNDPQSGLIEDFSQLASPTFDAEDVQPEVADFYEHTSSYDLDAWGEWCGLFRPFGMLLAFIFSRRLQQLNVPLSSLDTSRGITSEIVQLFDKASSKVYYTAWVREIIGTGNVLYAGSYSLCRVPGYDGLCVKVVFPLPNGSAIVVMKPERHSDGSFSVTSSGESFGDPGFYFLVKNASGRVSTRYVRAMRESIRVYAAEHSTVRADHTLKLWGITFLKLHYKMRKKQTP